MATAELAAPSAPVNYLAAAPTTLAPGHASFASDSNSEAWRLNAALNPHLPLAALQAPEYANRAFVPVPVAVPVPTTRNVIETAVHKLSYELWKSKFAVFNAISVAFQIAVAIVEPAVVSGVINAALKTDLQRTVSKVLKKFEEKTPGLFPAGMNFDELAKKVVDESLPKQGDKNKQQKPKASLDDFSSELKTMVGFNPEDEAAAREFVARAALAEAQKSSSEAASQTYYIPQPPPPPQPSYGTTIPPPSYDGPTTTEATYSPPSTYTPSPSTYAPPPPPSTYAPPQQPSTYAPPQQPSTYAPPPPPPSTYVPPQQTTYAPPSPSPSQNYAPPQQNSYNPPPLPPPYAVTYRGV